MGGRGVWWLRVRELIYCPYIYKHCVLYIYSIRSPPNAWLGLGPKQAYHDPLDALRWIGGLRGNLQLLKTKLGFQHCLSLIFGCDGLLFKCQLYVWVLFDRFCLQKCHFAQACFYWHVQGLAAFNTVLRHAQLLYVFRRVYSAQFRHVQLSVFKNISYISCYAVF